MYRIRTILAVAAATAAATALLPAAPAAADIVNRSAHAHFGSPAGNMYLDVSRPAVGATTVDVEWSRVDCSLTDGLYVCDSVSRQVSDAPVTRFRFDLTEAQLTATVPYRELRRHCERVVETETETCTAEPETTGTTDLGVTWTAVGEPRRETYVGDNGSTYVSTAVDTTVAGSGFGVSYDDPANSFGVLSRSREITPVG